MVAQPHPYRCEMCAYWDKDKHPHTICKLTNDALEGEDIAFIERHGCCSHSQHQSAEQRIADVIKELEETICKTDELYTMDFTGDAYNSLRDHIKKAIALLREGK